MGFLEVTINLYKATLFVENQVFPEESVTYRKLIQELLDRGISALTFSDGFAQEDATALVGLLAEEKIRDIDAARIYLDQHGVTHLTVAETTTLEDPDKESQQKENKARAREVYNSGVAAMRDVETQVKLGKVFEVQPLQGVVSSMLDNLFQDPAAVLGLTAIKKPRRLHAQPRDQRVHPGAVHRRCARAWIQTLCTRWVSRHFSTTWARCASPRTSSTSKALSRAMSGRS